MVCRPATSTVSSARSPLVGVVGDVQHVVAPVGRSFLEELRPPISGWSASESGRRAACQLPVLGSSQPPQVSRRRRRSRPRSAAGPAPHSLHAVGLGHQLAMDAVPGQRLGYMTDRWLSAATSSAAGRCSRHTAWRSCRLDQRPELLNGRMRVLPAVPAGHRAAGGQAAGAGGCRAVAPRAPRFGGDLPAADCPAP